MSDYCPAEICMNGHVISKFKTGVETYCSNCGAKTISKCPSCGSAIRGAYDNTYDFGLDYKCPSYCYSCGNPYPWTKSQIEAVTELLVLDQQLSVDKKEYISSNINSLTNDAPKTKAVATKVKLYLSEAATTGNAIKDILVDILSETAKKIIFG